MEAGAQSDCLAEVLLHVARGFSTLPLRATTKEPNVPLIRRIRGSGSWRTFQERPAGEDEVRAWLDTDPATSIGIVTGEASGGLVVLDDDGAAPILELPTTATVRTGRGRHFYFRSPEALRSRSFHWGEIRAERAYVAAPLSLHPSGIRYRWHLTPEEAGLADFAEVELAEARPYLHTFYLSPKGTALPSTCPKIALAEVDEGVALRLGGVLGVPQGIEIGEPFPCLLHLDRRPSAALWRARRDHPVYYHDFHAAHHGGDAWLPLPQLRARLAGREGRLGKPEH
jgi:hypothetical protein